MAKSTWSIDASHSLVEFSVRHLMISSVKGRFSEVEGELVTDPDNLEEGELSVTIQTKSVNTHDEKRDEHLCSDDFFDVEKHPTMTFQGRTMKHVKDDKYELTGDLTIKGNTNPVTLDVTYTGKGNDPWGNERMGFSAEGVISRKDFGLTWNAPLETGGVLVGDEVKISIEVQVVKPGEE